MSDLTNNVTIDAIERQIERSNAAVGANANSKYNENNYLNTRLKQGENSRKMKIRILPVSEEDSSFCVEVKIHSLNVPKEVQASGYKSFFCLNDENVPGHGKGVCPICAKSYELNKKGKELRNAGEEEKADTMKAAARSMMSKTAYILRVIDRSKEDEGVKFWRFNKNYKGEGIYDKLLTLFKNRRESYIENGRGDDYNIFDLVNGRDIILTITRQFDKSGKELQPSYQIDAEDFEKPLSKDVDQMNQWIQDPKKWYDVYSVRPAEYLKIVSEGMVPVKDADGNWVAKESEAEAKAEKEAVREEARAELLTQQPSDDGGMKSGNTDDEDLPF